MSIFKTFFLLFLCFIWTSPALGRANLSIWPVEVSLWPENKISEINLSNKGLEVVRLQIYAKHWDMDKNGKFIEADTGEFVFYPRLLTIPAGETKTLRVGYNGDFPPLEKSYRLYIHELPELNQGEKENSSGVKVGFNMLMRLSVPLFVSPSKKSPLVQPIVDTVNKTTSGIKVSLSNPGANHLEIKNISAKLTDNKGATLTKGEAKLKFFRILPKRNMFIEVPLDVKQCGAAAQLQINFLLGKGDKEIKMTMPLHADCRKI
ncbi:MAG: fimbria/pilus periplasmic chaperone [Desulfobulbaceae bacterium]|nr:fimbria/pilus periplasmic chaperone [Desulfobulbaceae bacterium]